MYFHLKPILFAITLAALLSACSSINLNPFSTGSKENARTPQAVSYTHLDVYKRQGWYCIASA